MPIIKSAIKRMKQNTTRRARNFPVRSELKTLIKRGLKLVKDGNVEEAIKHMPMAYSIIDKACKKKIIHENNAARKKSRLARALNELQSKNAPVKEAAKKDDAKA